MTEFAEKHYSIDPGKGKKMPGCPYSTFEDGHDVQDFIIPPQGYVFAGFKFDPNASNQIYDGKLTAEYTKVPFTQRIMSNLWKLVLVIAIVLVVALVVVLAVSVFRNPKPSRTEKEPETKVQPTTTAKNKDNSNTANFDETPAAVTTNPSEPKAPEVAPVVKETPTTPAVVEETPVTPVVETPKPATDDPNTLFKQEFWTLIHTRNASMDTYTDLYNKYKSKVSGEEFDYLRFVILKDYVSFKAWYDKMKTVPESQLNTIENIDGLRSNLKASK